MNAITERHTLVRDWRSEFSELFGRHLIQFEHDLAATGLFNREAVAGLIERCPADELGIVARHLVDGVQTTELGVRGDLSGKDAINAVERGRMWVNIRRIMDWAPEYRQLLDQVFSEFEELVPGLKTSRRNIGVLVSSPRAEVFYHSDIQGQLLWQIEGVKRVMLYPNSAPFLQPQSIENIVMRRTTEDINYHAWFDDYATSIDLQPGQALTWPLFAPHRVVNHDCLNISVTMEYWNRPIWNAYAVHYGNGVLRQLTGFRQWSENDHGLHVYPKAALAFLWKKLGRQIRGEVDTRRMFRLDAETPAGIAPHD